MSFEITRLLAGRIDILVAWISHSAPVTIVAGMLALFRLQWFFSKSR